jgi:ribokinase
LNIDEIWEVPGEFLSAHDLRAGEESVQDLEWFHDFYPELESKGALRALAPGGSSANTIAALRRMGFRTGFYGACGKDDAFSLRLSSLGHSDDLRVMKCDAPSGRCLSLISREDPDRDRRLIIFPNANDLAGSEKPDPAFFNRAHWLHMTSFVADHVLEAQVEAASSIGEGTRISFDPGPIYAARGLSILYPLLTRTKILFGDMTELERLTDYAEDPVSLLHDIGVELIIEKRGPAGIAAHVPGKEIYRPPAAVNIVKDRTGAGDVAAAGFLAGLMTGLGLENSLEIAAAAAARSIEGFGRSAYPDRDFYDRMIMNRVKEQIFD